MANLISYIPPVGEDLQHERTKDTLLMHNDLYLLLNMSKLAVSDRIADSVLDRCNKAIALSQRQSEVSTFDETLKSVVPDAFDDDTLSSLGRFDQGLNAQKRKIEAKLKRIDDYKASLKSKKEQAQLDRINKGIQNYLKFMYDEDADV